MPVAGLKTASLCSSDGIGISVFFSEISIHQVTKGAWWMPWHLEAMKDVASCDKLRGAASRR